tara:strand:+ start:64 stop:528 length:465 start_codon:yes stop_codon:yes gene_type:complete
MIEIKFDCDRKFETLKVKNFVENSIDLILEMLKNGSDEVYVSVFLTNNDKIKEINFKYRNINKVTNVLSFSQNENRMLDNNKNCYMLGDIVISLEKILSEAKEQKKYFYDHLLHMLTHSLLHLKGYDHENNLNAKIMEEKERDILLNLLNRVSK